MRTAAAVFLLAGLLGFATAACGSDGTAEDAAETPTGAGTTTEAATTETAETDTTEAVETETAETVSGEQVFASAGCGDCHTLEEANATGTVGPELDGQNLSVDEVAEQVRQGGGAMPAFADQLSDAEIQAVAEFVAEASQ